jgi:ribosomal protein L6P/L9E
VTTRWFVELEMKGLGFKTFFTMNEKLYKIDLGYNHYIFYKFDNFIGGVKTKRRSRFIIIYGIDKLELFNIVHDILSFRPVTSYKFRGIKFKDKQLILKIGKKKQFF